MERRVITLTCFDSETQYYRSCASFSCRSMQNRYLKWGIDLTTLLILQACLFRSSRYRFTTFSCKTSQILSCSFYSSPASSWETRSWAHPTAQYTRCPWTQPQRSARITARSSNAWLVLSPTTKSPRSTRTWDRHWSHPWCWQCRVRQKHHTKKERERERKKNSHHVSQALEWLLVSSHVQRFSQWRRSCGVQQEATCSSKLQSRASGSVRPDQARWLRRIPSQYSFRERELNKRSKRSASRMVVCDLFFFFSLLLHQLFLPSSNIVSRSRLSTATCAALRPSCS